MIIWELAAIAVLIMLNGYFSMAEMAIVSARRAQLRELADHGSKGARVALELAGNPGRFFSTVQIGITLVGVLAGAFGGATLADKLGAFLNTMAFVRPYGHAAAIFLVVALITYLSLVIGELVPKQLAIQNPERIASSVAPVMRRISRAAAPAVALLEKSTRAVLRALGISAEIRAAVSEREVKALLREGIESGVFEEAEHGMVAEVLRLDVRPVRTVMTPRTDVVWLDVADDAATLLRKLNEGDHSRFPVCEKTLNNVVGVVAAKRLLRQLLQTGRTDIRETIVAPLIVPESMPVLELLERFKAARPHMAVVVDEYADVQGVVTPTDILETIAGEFIDEQGGPPTIIQREDGSWLVDARVELQELADRLGFGAPDADPYVSLAAFLLRAFQRIPTEGETITVDGWRFEVADMDGRRIDKVLVLRLDRQPANVR